MAVDEDNRGTKNVLKDIYLLGYVSQVLTTTLAALAEPNRLGIVDFLREGPQPVAAIGEKVGLGQPQVSKHLRVLRDAGLVLVEPRGRERHYVLRAEPLRELDAWLDKFRVNWGKRFDQLDNLLRELKTKGNRNA
ncbi:MAG TPA: metalloregulator ArsR/SmtB family transcription factor, partial [Polyangiaceae bacterium]|nr:metalloregulator ArsR/SmtB family transcription factor [Polyangiaceae bacterium]